MSEQLPANVFSCTQCGGELHLDEGQHFVTCPFCASTVFIDKSRVVFHWYLAPTLDETRAQAALRQWMAGNQTVKNLDKKAHLESSAFMYFPVWYFKHRTADKREQISLQPAAATSVTELIHINLPAGDLRKFDPALETDIQPPTVPLEAAQQRQEIKLGDATTIIETALVHLPVFTFKYRYKGERYTALVEGATGATLANIYPAKSESPYWIAAGASIITFLLLALAPIAGIVLDPGDGSGFGIGTLICVGLGIPLFIVLFILAMWVAAKV